MIADRFARAALASARFDKKRDIAIAALLALLALGSAFATQAPSNSERISRLGVYEGYATAAYDGWVRQSQYIAVRDGTRLAMDMFRPTRNGVVETRPLPLVWVHTRYQRANITRGKMYTVLDYIPYLARLLEHGYIVAIVDVRGSGASFGSKHGWFPAEEGRDAYDVTEWFAAQSFSDGNIGMFGRSYLGITQYFAAGEAPPHLKAIFPEMTWFDEYEFAYPGGIFMDWVVQSWSALVKTADSSAALPGNWRELRDAYGPGSIAALTPIADCPRVSCATMGGRPGQPVLPVDADTEGSMLAAAVESHLDAIDTHTLSRATPYRDSVTLEGERFHESRSPHRKMETIRESGVAAYHLNGWYDGFTKEALLWYRNYPNAQKLVIGPWYHSDVHPLDLGAEMHRWFDRWLKGIDSGVMADDPVHYWTLGAPAGMEWRSASQWPLKNERRTRYYFHAGPTGSAESANDGLLAAGKPPAARGADDYTVDYTTSVGIDNRWTYTAAGSAGTDLYSGIARNERRGLTYTTNALKEDVEITGHPVVHLWVTANAADADFFAYLTEVRADGTSIYRTEGKLRASHRKLSQAPFDNMGLPYHRSYLEDITPLEKGIPAELVFDLQPTSASFRAGSRIRVTITGADKDTYRTPVQTPAPTISILRAAEHASYIELPVIPSGSRPARLPPGRLGGGYKAPD